MQVFQTLIAKDSRKWVSGKYVEYYNGMEFVTGEVPILLRSDTTIEELATFYLSLYTDFDKSRFTQEYMLINVQVVTV